MCDWLPPGAPATVRLVSTGCTASANHPGANELLGFPTPATTIAASRPARSSRSTAQTTHTCAGSGNYGSLTHPHITKYPRISSAAMSHVPWWMLKLYPDAQTLLVRSGVEQNPGPANNGYLKISHVNINSITSPHRLDELSDFADSSSTDILMITETKLDDTVHPSLYKLHNYHDPYIKNRSRHGGWCGCLL